MKSWNPKTIAWYMQAGEHSQYPGEIIAQILPRLRAGDTVLDIGCGPGVYALALAPYVAEYLALDKNRDVLDNVEKMAASRGLNNIDCLHYTWPHAPAVREADVIICALGSGEIMTGKDNILAMFSLRPRFVFLVAPGSYLPPFGWRQHRRRPGPEGRDTLALLDSLNVKYDVQTFSLDFGQPVETMAEAAEFLAQFLDLPPSRARELAAAIALPHSQGLYLPNRRNFLLITLDTPREK